MKKPIFVVIPVYNAEKYLEITVHSVLDQPHANVQIILVDDGSPDSSPQICDKLCEADSRICVIHQGNGGVSKARNTGIEAALEKTMQINDDAYIAFLDADDMWKQNMNWDVEDGENADIIAYSSVMSNAKGNRFQILHRFDRGNVLGDGANLAWVNNGHFAAFLYRAGFVREYNLRFLEGVTRNEDVIFWRQATFAARKILFSPEILLIYRMHGGSVMHNGSISYIETLHIPKAWNRAIEWIRSLPTATDIQKERWAANCAISVGSTLLECARILAQHGYSVEQIKGIILENPLAKQIDGLTVEALAQWQKEDLVMFRTDLEGFVRYHKKQGRLIEITRKISKLPVIKKVFENRRYNLLEIT